MKGMALESVAKWIILSVVAIIIINLTLFFSDKIKNFISIFTNPSGKFKTELIESKEFSTSQLITYIRACWDRTGENFEEDVVCFILRGDMSKVDVLSLGNALTYPASVNTTKFDNSKNFAIVRFENLGNRVILEN